jgi:hypothetical protein
MQNTGGIQYLPGGVASGFNHVVRDVFPTRLLHLKGDNSALCLVCTALHHLCGCICMLPVDILVNTARYAVL